MINYQKREPVYMYVHCTAHTVQTETCSGITHTGRTGAHNTPNQTPIRTTNKYSYSNQLQYLNSDICYNLEL